MLKCRQVHQSLSETRVPHASRGKRLTVVLIGNHRFRAKQGEMADRCTSDCPPPALRSFPRGRFRRGSEGEALLPSGNAQVDPRGALSAIGPTSSVDLPMTQHPSLRSHLRFSRCTPDPSRAGASGPVGFPGRLIPRTWWPRRPVFFASTPQVVGADDDEVNGSEVDPL
jgi:hypothetical protein